MKYPLKCFNAEYLSVLPYREFVREVKHLDLTAEERKELYTQIKLKAKGGK